MAVVRNKAESGNILNYDSPTDREYFGPNRTNNGKPNGVLTPLYAGEIVLDTVSNALWKAVNLTNSGWVALTPF